MNLPNWRTSTAGTKVRVALWLATEVGEGGVFTKANLRDAFPAVEQVDRRMRDLRDESWTIATNRDDISLAPDELRLLKIGGAVWSRNYESRAPKPLTARERQAVFAAADYCCSICGITGGESYPDEGLRKAKLTVAGSSTPQGTLRCLCDRCRAGAAEPKLDSGLLATVASLEAAEKVELLGWIKQGRRPRSSVEAAWARYSQLSPGDRSAVEDHLRSAAAEQRASA